MFEVGKHYKGSTTGRIAKVLFVGEQISMVKIIEAGAWSRGAKVGEEDTIPNSVSPQWHEWEMPKVDTEELFIKWNEVSGFFADEKPSGFGDAPGTVLRGKVRFTYTGGDPGSLKVEVL